MPASPTPTDTRAGDRDTTQGASGPTPGGQPDPVLPTDPWRQLRDWSARPLVRRGGSVLAVVGWALVVATWAPRGPQTTSEALVSIVVSLGVGALAGWAWRSRWAMLAAPVAFAVVVELLRLDVVGPSVDMVRTSQLGLFVLVSGRIVHGLLSLVPMALGAAVGAGYARYRAGQAPGRRVTAGRAGTVVVGLALLALVVGLIRPATTAPITDASGDVVPDSIAELTTVEVDGRELGLMVRGHDVDNPVLLFLAGGPGGSEFGAMRNHLPALEEHVTVATWDQRGTGTSYDALDPTDTLTLEAAVDDTIAVTDHLRARFGQDRILLAGQSWGTTLGVLAIQVAPERYRGYVGTGQMVSQLETDRLMYDDAVDWAREGGRNDLAARLESIGPPPWDDMLNYEAVLSNPDVEPYDHSQNSEGESAWASNFVADEYSLLDTAHLMVAMADTYSVLYPQLQEIDFRDTATTFDVPMFFVQGAHEARGRAELFADWYPMVDAPTKDVTTLATSGHRPLWEQPDAFVDYVVDTVLPATAPAG